MNSCKEMNERVSNNNSFDYVSESMKGTSCALIPNKVIAGSNQFVSCTGDSYIQYEDAVSISDSNRLVTRKYSNIYGINGIRALAAISGMTTNKIKTSKDSYNLSAGSNLYFTNANDLFGSHQWNSDVFSLAVLISGGKSYLCSTNSAMKRLGNATVKG